MGTPRERTADRPRAERAARTSAVRTPAPGTAAILALGVAAAVVVVLIRLAFPDRSDYAGHFLAGTGATVLLLAVIGAFSRSLEPPRVFLLCLVAIALGFGTENTIFREAAYDWVDFAVQSSGAALASLAFLAPPDARRNDVSLGVGLVLLVVGCGFAFG